MLAAVDGAAEVVFFVGSGTARLGLVEWLGDKAFAMYRFAAGVSGGDDGCDTQ